MTPISGILQQEMQQQGVISFARFMEVSLYCPGFGYYEQESHVIGRLGDYYTSVSVGSLFGNLLGFQFAEWLESHSSRQFCVVETGAHDGRLAADILGWFVARRPTISRSLEYWVIEPSMVRRNWQKNTLDNFAGQVRWFDSVDSLPEKGVNGILFANELLDAMPVHRFGWDAGSKRWFEWGVAAQDDGFVWHRLPDEMSESGRLLREAGWNLPEELLEVLPDGFIIEVAPAAAEWWHKAARVLREGKLIAIDYGFTAEEYLVPQRTQGTLRAYLHHHPSNHVLANPGEQDLTAHVNFSLLQRVGESEGLRTEGLLSQSRFLTAIAEKTWQEDSGFGRWSAAYTRQFQTLTHSSHLGQAFRVLVQSPSP